MTIANAFFKSVKQMGRSIASEYDRVLMALYFISSLVFLYFWMDGNP